MNYVEHLNFYGVDAKEIPCIKGNGAPTTETVGAVGLFYMDTNSGDVYKCISAEGNSYNWVSFNNTSNNAVLYTEQELTDDQKEQARANIGALGCAKIETETLPFTYCSNYADNTTFAYTPITNPKGYFMYECGEIKGGVLSVNWDTTLVSKIELIIYLFDAEGNPYKYAQKSSPVGSNSIPFAGENVNVVWSDPGQGGGFCWTDAPFTVQIPEGCKPMVCFRSTNTVIPDTNTVFPQSDIYLYAKTLFNVTVSTTEASNDLYNALIATGLFEEIPEGDKALKNFDATVKSVNHRGYNSIAPENTISAYKLSKEYGFYYVEADVSFTSDGVPVLLHDATIDRTSNGTGTISEMTFEQVRTYDFGSWKSADYAGELIPSFEEFIIFCKKAGLHPYIEVKSPFTTDNAQTLVDIVKRCGMIDKVTWISFSNTYLGYIKGILPSARLGQVTGTITETTITNASSLITDTNEVFVDAQFNVLTDDMVNLCIDADIPLEVWNVFTDENVTSANGYISGMTTDSILAGKVLQESVK